MVKQGNFASLFVEECIVLEVESSRVKRRGRPEATAALPRVKALKAQHLVGPCQYSSLGHVLVGRKSTFEQLEHYRLVRLTLK